jgi:hypothetical protein
MATAASPATRKARTAAKDGGRSEVLKPGIRGFGAVQTRRDENRAAFFHDAGPAMTSLFEYALTLSLQNSPASFVYVEAAAHS